MARTRTSQTPIKELNRGSILAGRYEIIEELGRGGMGNVYRVLDKKINEEIALKLIKPAIATDEKIIDPAYKEYRRVCAQCYMKIGEFERATELLKEALEFEPDDTNLRLFYAR